MSTDRNDNPERRFSTTVNDAHRNESADRSAKMTPELHRISDALDRDAARMRADLPGTFEDRVALATTPRAEQPPPELAGIAGALDALGRSERAAAPADLEQSVVLASGAALRRKGAAGVAGRLIGAPLRLAAAIALVATVGLLWYAVSSTRPGASTPRDDGSKAVLLASIDHDIDELFDTMEHELRYGYVDDLLADTAAFSRLLASDWSMRAALYEVDEP